MRYQGTDKTHYQKLPDGTLLTYATEAGNPEGRRTYENHMSLDQFAKLAEWVLGEDALAKPEDVELVAASGDLMLGSGALAGFKAAIALARMSEQAGANVRASLEAADDWSAEMILGYGEQTAKLAAAGGLPDKPIVVHGDVQPAEINVADEPGASTADAEAAPAADDAAA